MTFKWFEQEHHPQDKMEKRDLHDMLYENHEFL